MPARRRAKAKKGVLSILASLPVSPCLVVTEACPYCEKPHTTEAGTCGVWNDLKTYMFVVLYFLCTPCACCFEKASFWARERMRTGIEDNLAAMGVLKGLEQEGLQA